MSPKLPPITLEKLQDLPADGPGFLTLVRERWRARLPTGEDTPLFVYDSIHRAAMHAVVVVAHYEVGGETYVYLRSCVRPPLMHVTLGSPKDALGMWELPAGLIEPQETPSACASRETQEELGFVVPEEKFRALGSFVFPAPGMIAERQYFFQVQVDPATRQEPELDGSSLEMGGEVIALPLTQCLSMAREGRLQDSKSELGLRRLEELLREQ